MTVVNLVMLMVPVVAGVAVGWAIPRIGAALPPPAAVVSLTVAALTAALSRGLRWRRPASLSWPGSGRSPRPHTEPSGATLLIPNESDDPGDTLRRQTKAVLDSFIRPRAHIWQKVNDFS